MEEPLYLVLPRGLKDRRQDDYNAMVKEFGNHYNHWPGLSWSNWEVYIHKFLQAKRIKWVNGQANGE